MLGFLGRIRGQKIVSTQNPGVLSYVPLTALRRVVRHGGRDRALQVPPQSLSKEHLRRIRYHVLARRPDALLARCWLLVEGETEAWPLPAFARHLGYRLGA